MIRDWVSKVLSVGCIVFGFPILWNFLVGSFLGIDLLLIPVSSFVAVIVLWGVVVSGFCLGVWYWIDFLWGDEPVVKLVDSDTGDVVQEGDFFGEEESDKETENS